MPQRGENRNSTEIEALVAEIIALRGELHTLQPDRTESVRDPERYAIRLRKHDLDTLRDMAANNRAHVAAAKARKNRPFPVGPDTSTNRIMAEADKLERDTFTGCGEAWYTAFCALDWQARAEWRDRAEAYLDQENVKPSRDRVEWELTIRRVMRGEFRKWFETQNPPDAVVEESRIVLDAYRIAELADQAEQETYSNCTEPWYVALCSLSEPEYVWWREKGKSTLWNEVESPDPDQIQWELRIRRRTRELFRRWFEAQNPPDDAADGETPSAEEFAENPLDIETEPVGERDDAADGERIGLELAALVDGLEITPDAGGPLAAEADAAAIETTLTLDITIEVETSFDGTPETLGKGEPAEASAALSANQDDPDDDPPPPSARRSGRVASLAAWKTPASRLSDTTTTDVADSGPPYPEDAGESGTVHGVECGHSEPADFNAARIIKRRGIRTVTYFRASAGVGPPSSPDGTPGRARRTKRCGGNSAPPFGGPLPRATTADANAKLGSLVVSGEKEKRQGALTPCRVSNPLLRARTTCRIDPRSANLFRKDP